MLYLAEDFSLLVREFGELGGLLFETSDRQVAVRVDSFYLVVVVFSYRVGAIGTFFGLFLLHSPRI